MNFPSHHRGRHQTLPQHRPMQTFTLITTPFMRAVHQRRTATFTRHLTGRQLLHRNFNTNVHQNAQRINRPQQHRTPTHANRFTLAINTNTRRRRQVIKKGVPLNLLVNKRTERNHRNKIPTGRNVASARKTAQLSAGQAPTWRADIPKGLSNSSPNVNDTTLCTTVGSQT